MSRFWGIISEQSERIQERAKLSSYSESASSKTFVSDTIQSENYFFDTLRFEKRKSILNGEYQSEEYLAIVDGLFFNYDELKKVISADTPNAIQSQAELIVGLYTQYGIDFIQKIDGVFALILYDKKAGNVILARDPIGERFLYYSYVDGEVICSNEIHPILKSNNQKNRLNPEAVNHFLALGYVLQPWTLYENIFQVEAGQIIEIHLKENHIRKKEYFRLSEYFSDTQTTDEKEAQEQIRFLLEEAIRKRVPEHAVGLFVSGGLDSSILAYYLKNILRTDGRYYTFSFEPPQYDEFEKAQTLADFLEIEVKSITAPHQVSAQVLDFISNSDYIPADNAIFPLHFLSEAATQEVNYVLTGDGADELFGGYPTQFADKLNPYLNFLHFLKHTHTVRKWKDLNNKLNWKVKIGRFIHGTHRDYRKAHFQWRQILSPEERIQLLGIRYKELIYDTDPFLKFAQYYNQVKHLEIPQQHLFVDFKTWLPDNILLKTNQAVRKSGLESLSPFLDLNLVRFTCSLSWKYKKNKLILRNAMKGLLPDQIIFQKKAGLNTPIGAWMNTKENEYNWLTKHLYRHYESNIHRHSGI